MILFFAYICENHPLYPHDEKSYDRDQFFFLVVLLFLFGFYTLHKNGHDEPASLDATASGSSSSRSVRESTSSSNAARDTVDQDISKNSICDSLSIVEDCRQVLVEERSSSLYKSNVSHVRVKEAKSYNDVLNRDQTEEWKGW
jgi:hypothetical protein